MDQLKGIDRRRIVGNYYIKFKHLGKTHTVKYFQRMNVKRTTIYSIIRRLEKNGSVERKSGSGRPAIKMPKKKVNALKDSLIGKLGISQRKLANRFNIGQSYLCKILKKNGVKHYKRHPKSKTSDSQKIIQKKRLIRLSKGKLRPNNGLEVVMDDESYFPMTGHNIPGNDGYYAIDRSEVDSDVKYRSTEKFPKKVLVWIAISSKGYSQPFFAIRDAMNKEIYSNECLRKRLIPFIRDNHSNTGIVFWPDLATCHYAKLTIQTYEELKLKYIKREENPPNVPQLRAIEKFWAHLKTKVYSGGWEAKDHYHLIQ